MENNSNTRAITKGDEYSPTAPCKKLLLITEHQTGRVTCMNFIKGQ